MLTPMEEKFGAEQFDVDQERGTMAVIFRLSALTLTSGLLKLVME